jgi:hypothetical protein
MPSLIFSCLCSFFVSAFSKRHDKGRSHRQGLAPTLCFLSSLGGNLKAKMIRSEAHHTRALSRFTSGHPAKPKRQRRSTFFPECLRRLTRQVAAICVDAKQTWVCKSDVSKPLSKKTCRLNNRKVSSNEPTCFVSGRTRSHAFAFLGERKRLNGWGRSSPCDLQQTETISVKRVPNVSAKRKLTHSSKSRRPSPR